MASSDNPYVGLRPFNSNESLLFFGRNEQVVQLLKRLHAHHFVAVVGGSGSGKSSLIRAGLIPALKAGYLVDDSDQWSIDVMKPGMKPIRNLSKAVLRLAQTSSSKSAVREMVTQIEEVGADVILDTLRPLHKRDQSNFFLLIDQFEELFRFSMDSGEKDRQDEAVDFVNILLELAEQSELPIYVVLTMRSDFIGDCAQFYGLPEAMNKSQYLVPRMGRQQLKQVIESPARLYGKAVSSRLTSKLLNSINDVTDELPLLQHALMRMWEYEINEDRSETLDLADFDAIGGLDKALSMHANEALEKLSKKDRKLAASIFKALTTVDGNGRKIRRPVQMSELLKLTGADQSQIMAVINQFIANKRSFIIVGDEEDQMIDISHESLIRQWKQLDIWADQEAQAAENYLKLTGDYQLFKQEKKDHLSGKELELAMEWYSDFEPNANWASRYNDDFKDIEKFLLESERIEQEAKSELAKKEARVAKFKRYFIIALIVLGPLSTFFVTREVANTMGIEFIDFSSAEAQWETAKAANNLQAYIAFREANPNSKFDQQATDSIYKLESALDAAHYKEAAEMDNLSAYNKYIIQYDSLVVYKDTINLSKAENRIRYLQDQLDRAENPALQAEAGAWDQLKLSNETFSDLVQYILATKKIDDSQFLLDATVIEHQQYVFQQIDDKGREGWLFSGRLSNDQTKITGDAPFEVVWRDVDVEDPTTVPEKGNYLLSKLTRSTYRLFDPDGFVMERNDGEPMLSGEYAILSKVELFNNVVFFKIKY